MLIITNQQTRMKFDKDRVRFMKRACTFDPSFDDRFRAEPRRLRANRRHHLRWHGFCGGVREEGVF